MAIDSGGRVSGKVCLWGSCISRRGLSNGVDVEVGRTTTEILRTLDTGIRTNDTEMGPIDFDVTCATSCIPR